MERMERRGGEELRTQTQELRVLTSEVQTLFSSEKRVKTERQSEVSISSKFKVI